MMESKKKGGEAMNALTILKSDHEHIRWILERLEQGVAGEPEFSKTDYIGWVDLLSGALKEHIRQEERYLFKFLESAIGKGMKSYHAGEEHGDIQHTIQVLKGLLHQEGPISQETLRSHTAHLVCTLKEHMDLEENVIYPRAEKELGYSMLQALGPFMAATH